MKLFSSLLTATFLVIISSCSSEKQPEPSDVAPGADASVAKEPTLESSPGLEAVGNGGVNATGITPMDVTRGQPTPQTNNTSNSSDSGAATSSSLPPGIPMVLGDGESTLRVLRSGKAAPGEGPKGPDGEVIDPQAVLKQLQEKQVQEATKNAPQPPSPSSARPPQASELPPTAPAIKRLDPSEAPKLPRSSAPNKDE